MFSGDADENRICNGGGKNLYGAGVFGESHKAKYGEVVAWREIEEAEPDPKPETRERWLVIPMGFIEDWQMFDGEPAAIETAKSAAKEHGCEVKVYRATEACIVKPGEPEITKLEE